MRLNIKEAARQLDVSEATVRRRLHRGDLAGVQITTPQGFVWLVDLPDTGSQKQEESALDIHSGRTSLKGEVEHLQEMVVLLRHELDLRNRELEARSREITQLHLLLQQSRSRDSEQSDDERARSS